MSVGTKPSNDAFFSTREAARNAAVAAMRALLGGEEALRLTTPARELTRYADEAVTRKTELGWARLRFDSGEKAGECWDLEVQIGKA